MKVLELFAGTRCIGKAFEQRGHEVFSVEWSRDFDDIDMYADIGQITAQDILIFILPARQETDVMLLLQGHPPSAKQKTKALMLVKSVGRFTA